MRVMLINPWDKTVKEVDTKEWSIDVIYELLTHDGRNPTDDFNIVNLAPKVALYVDGEGFLKPDVPVWYIIGHGKHDELRPLCGMGVLFGNVDNEGDDVGLPEYISEKFCQAAVTWSGQTSTGTLTPTRETENSIIIGEPILKGERNAS